MEAAGLLGIFVGGVSRRMGGYPKGLLRAPDTQEALVLRLARLGREARLTPVFVGRAEPYRELLPDLGELMDRPPNVGPLGGLAALLHAAKGGRALAVACDMPHVSARLLARLLHEEPEAPVLAARSEGGLWEPLCARYDAARVLPEVEAALRSDERSFQGLFARLPVTELGLSAEERAELGDWDRPEDVSGQRER